MTTTLPSKHIRTSHSLSTAMLFRRCTFRTTWTHSKVRRRVLNRLCLDLTSKRRRTRNSSLRWTNRINSISYRRIRLKRRKHLRYRATSKVSCTISMDLSKRMWSWRILRACRLMRHSRRSKDCRKTFMTHRRFLDLTTQQYWMRLRRHRSLLRGIRRTCHLKEGNHQGPLCSVALLPSVFKNRSLWPDRASQTSSAPPPAKAKQAMKWVSNSPASLKATTPTNSTLQSPQSWWASMSKPQKDKRIIKIKAWWRFRRVKNRVARTRTISRKSSITIWSS